MNLFLQTQHYFSRGAKMACAPLLAALLLSETTYATLPGTKVISNVTTKSTARATITGTVKDEKGEPLPGVSVKVKGTTIGTTTDVNGNYKLNIADEKATLVFSFLGYETREVVANGQAIINIQMKESTATLKEVVVNVGYGTKKKDDVMGSVAVLDAKEIEDLPVPNIAAALRNRIAGVGVDAASGKPGSSININIRNAPISEQSKAWGATTDPLFIIDGIIVSKSEFESIDPSMVENVSFLKDASAAIYGAAGAKGVVLITTKKGRPGKPKISYTGYLGYTDAASSPKMLSAYDHAKLLNDGYRIANESASNLFSNAELEQLKSNASKGWFDQLWKVAQTQRHNFNVSGGTEAITFFAGGNYYSEGGNYGGIDYDKYSFRLGTNAKIIEGLTSTVTLSTDFSNRETQTYSNSDNDQNFFQQLVTTPYWIPMAIDGKPVNFSNRNNNPLAVMQSDNYIRNKNQGLTVNASLEYKPKFLKGLSARTQFGLTNRAGNGRQYVPAMTLYNFAPTGQNNSLISNQVTSEYNNSNSSLLLSTSRTTSTQFIAGLGYQRSFGNHSLDWIAATDISQNTTEDLAVKWSNQLMKGVDEFWAFDPSTFVRHNDEVIESAKISYLSRLNYNYNKRYFMEAIARLDYSSNFAPENRAAVFPSVGLGWNVSEENFFRDNVSFVNYFKLRANLGLVGDDRTTARLWQARYDVISDGYLYNESPTTGIRNQIEPNRDITWEKALNLNVGMDASLFHNKLNVTVDVYRRKNYDMFDKGNNENFPMYAGFVAPVVNYQEKTSWGSEFSIGYQSKINKNWGINSSVNFGFSNGIIDRMFYNENQLWDNAFPDLKYQFGTNPRKYTSENYGLKALGMFRTQAEVDSWLQKYPTYTVNGVVPQVGWLYYEDATGDGRITEKDQVLMYNTVSPAVGFGFNLGVTYKSLSLSSNIVARFGGKEFYDSKSREEATNTVNVPTYWNDHWSLDNPNGRFPRFDDPSIKAGWNSTFWAVDGTMIRINNMTLSYKVPKKLLSKFGLSDVRAVATGNNLWTIKNPLPFKDPYSSTIYDYPTLRTISFGLNVGI